MYEEKVRQTEVDGIKDWYWPKKDDGAWDGPVDDWLTSHKQIIMDLGLHKGCIQAGGNCGLYPILLSQIFQQVYTFEPDEQNRYFLGKNLISHNIKNVMKFSFGLGSEEKEVGINRGPESNVGMHTIAETGKGVQLIRLDSIPFENEIDLLWFDIEGYEYHALLGSVQTITKHKPVIALERPTYDCDHLLKSLGYMYHAKSKMDTFYVHSERRQ